MDEEMASQLMTQMAEIQASVDGPSTGWFTVGAAVIGFMAAMLSTVLVEYLKRRHETRILRASLMAEISAMAEIIRSRRYIQALQDGAEMRRFRLGVNVPDDYFIVYKSNTARLGLLSAHEAKRIVRLYHLVESVVQDVTPGGVLHKGGVVHDVAATGGGEVQEAFKQDVKFLEDALQLADELVGESGAK
ncbi:hypothetical protein [Halomonas salina]|uniref:Uncharacterized protein n=1 Tax=Halomonas salina TaxID=42565 RepID=A0ABR4WRR2_9GAMM|nr:hypothetical protein [Halomonas salina]KGE77407.1 hypothetical protein FP66_09935 [Halomonas salina]